MNIQHIGGENIPPEVKAAIEGALGDLMGNVPMSAITPNPNCQCPRCRLAALKLEYVKREDATIAEAKAIGAEAHSMGLFMDTSHALRDFVESDEFPKLISGFTRLKSDAGVKCITELQSAYKAFVVNMEAVMQEVQSLDEAKKAAAGVDQANN